MKYFFTIILSFSLYTACAQKATNNIDSIYYFLDTANTPVKEQMWDVGIESKYKYFTIKCPCLKYNSEPTFVYDLKNIGQRIDRNSFDKINTKSLATLITLAKQTSDLTAETLYVYFLIEKSGNNYDIHKVRLLTPRKRETSIDYENIPAEKTNKKNE